MDVEVVDVLNKKLAGEYVTIDGHKIFRLVWSESTFENRYGTFREFTEGGLFIREVTETRRTRKYNYIHNRWIFEMWAPGNLTANRELPDAANGDYVPVYVFEDRGGNYLPPNEKVVRFLIAALHGKIKRDEIPSREYLEEREIQKTMETMDDHPSWFQTRPGDTRNAIWYPGGVPRWEGRRSTLSQDVINQAEFQRVEREARERARARAGSENIEVQKAEAQARVVTQAWQEEENRKRSGIREAREAEMRLAADERQRKEREAAIEMQKIQNEQAVCEALEPQPKVKIESKSPMHRGQ